MMYTIENLTLFTILAMDLSICLSQVHRFVSCNYNNHILMPNSNAKLVASLLKIRSANLAG